jgi:putative glutamine amidotransferase
MKPLIGITRSAKVDDYVESVVRAGGEPVVLETNESPEAALDRVDGLLLTGGRDVDPELYGEEAHPLTEVDAARDRFEVPLTRAALARDVPLLAICRGVQVLNVAAGGSLVQDIPSAVGSAINHALNDPKHAIAHPVQVSPGTRLAELLGGTPAAAGCAVNSRHHQSVGTVAENFVVSAVSPDGVVEAIEDPGAAFCVGVQWHPENFWRTGEFAPLFDAFIEASRQRAGRPTRQTR